MRAYFIFIFVSTAANANIVFNGCNGAIQASANADPNGIVVQNFNIPNNTPSGFCDINPAQGVQASSGGSHTIGTIGTESSSATAYADISVLSTVSNGGFNLYGIGNTSVTATSVGVDAYAGTPLAGKGYIGFPATAVAQTSENYSFSLTTPYDYTLVLILSPGARVGFNGQNYDSSAGLSGTLGPGGYGISGSMYLAASVSAGGMASQQTSYGNGYFEYNLQLTPSPVPLPAAAGLLLSGLGVFGAIRKRVT